MDSEETVKVVSLNLREPYMTECYDEEFFEGFLSSIQYGQIIQQITKLTNLYLLTRYKIKNKIANEKIFIPENTETDVYNFNLCISLHMHHICYVLCYNTRRKQYRKYNFIFFFLFFV